jgi:hypothetical protein
MSTPSEKLTRIKNALENTEGGWDDVVKAVTDIVDEQSAILEDGYAPLFMGDTVIGRIKVNLENGNIDGHVNDTLSGILKEGLEDGILQVSFYGRATMPVMDAHERLQAYLERENHK